MKTDSFFYEFFLQFPQAFFALIGQDTQKAAMYTFKSVEVKGQPFRFDGIFLPKSKRDVLYFVEVQFGKDSTFYSRFFSEIFLYLRQYRPKNKWRAVVIFPEETVDPGVEHHYHEFVGTSRLQRIYLSKLSKQQFESFPLNLLQIITAPDEKVSEVLGDRKNDRTHDFKHQKNPLLSRNQARRATGGD